MHNPLKVPDGASVQYIDYVTRDSNSERFPDLRALKLVDPDLIEDGFALPSIENNSRDFLIANHVLEHSNNALKTLVRWAQVIRQKGVLFLSVPLADRCFDRGRAITSLAHFIEDYEAENIGNYATFQSNTLQHYIEYRAISMPAIEAEAETLAAKESARLQTSKTAEELHAEGAEIHFHTFSLHSFRLLLTYFCTEIRPDFGVLEIREQGIEVICILRRN